MPKDFKTDIVQPPGNHNKKHPCVKSSLLEEYLKLPFDYLNPLQSEFIRYLEEDDLNIIIAAPTSSGKTLCAEFFAARSIKMGRKILYLAPMKALADQKYDEWTGEDHSLSRNKIEIQTGDFSLSESKKDKLNEANIIILTPEMFNSKCRFFESHDWLKKSNIVVDESHLVGMSGRGDALEAGLIDYYEHNPKARALFLSATIPNLKDFVVWLEHLTENNVHFINNDYRPCKLNKKVISFSDIMSTGRKMTYALRENKRLEEVVKLISQYRNDPILVFVGSKDFGANISRRLKSIGIAHRYHNADLDRGTRKEIESGFLNLDFKVVIATTTLAWGCFKKGSFVHTGISSFKAIEDVDDYVLSSDKEAKFVKKSKFIKKITTSQPEEMVRIVLESGLSVICTKDHIFPTSSGEEKEARNMIVGKDELHSFRIDNISSDYCLRKFKEGTNIESPKDFFYLLGLIAGDGYLRLDSRRAIIDICFSSDDMDKKICSSLDKCGVKFRYGKKRKDKIKHIIIGDRSFASDLNKFLWYEDGYKLLDLDLIYSDQVILKNIIAGLLDSDGEIDSNKICFYNTSYGLVNFFVMSMKRFGIKTSCRLRNPQSNTIRKGEKDEHLIVGRKDIYEILIGSRKGIFFFHEEVSKFMGSLKKIDKIKNFIKSKNFKVKPKSLGKGNYISEKTFSPEKIRYIKKEKSKDIVYDLSIKNNNNDHYIVNGILAHNCNTPARYVICSHTKFGLTPMHPANIIQAAGRAGRIGYANEGDAIIVVPQSESREETKRIFSNYKISSVLNDLNILMFHVVSYVANGRIKSAKDLEEWYSKTLSSVQKNFLKPGVSQRILDNLSARGMVKKNNDNDNEYEITRLGQITAQFYMSPLDVSDWFRNFASIKKINPPRNCSEQEEKRINIDLALSLSKCYSFGLTWFKNKQIPNPEVYISNREKQSFVLQDLSRSLNLNPANNPYLKFTAIFYSLLTGSTPDSPLMSYYYNIQKDIDRTISVLKLIDSRVGKYVKSAKKCEGFGWDQEEWDSLLLRLKYGIKENLIDLVKIPGIGKKFAEKLYDNGIKTKKDFFNPSKKENVSELIGSKRFDNILSSASQ